MNELMPMVQDALVTVGTAVISLLAAYAVKAIRDLTVKLQVETIKLANEDERQLIEAAITRVNNLATTTVTSIEQTTAKALRESVKLGTADKKDLMQLAEDALFQIQTSLSDEYLIAIEDSFGDAEAYILNVIEQKVWELKNGLSAAPLSVE